MRELSFYPQNCNLWFLVRIVEWETCPTLNRKRAPLFAGFFSPRTITGWLLRGIFFPPASRLKPASFSTQLLSLSPASFSIQPVIAQLLNLSPASFSTQSVDWPVIPQLLNLSPPGFSIWPLSPQLLNLSPSSFSTQPVVDQWSPSFSIWALPAFQFDH